MSIDINSLTINHGMNLRKAKKICDALGVLYEPIRRTGELRFFFPGKPLTVNCRRKSAPRELTARLKKLVSAIKEGCALGGHAELSTA